MKEQVLARTQQFALVNTHLGLVEATSAWAYLLHDIVKANPSEPYEVRHLTVGVDLGTVETCK